MSTCPRTLAPAVRWTLTLFLGGSRWSPAAQLRVFCREDFSVHPNNALLPLKTITLLFHYNTTTHILPEFSFVNCLFLTKCKLKEDRNLACCVTTIFLRPRIEPSTQQVIRNNCQMNVNKINRYLVF